MRNLLGPAVLCALTLCSGCVSEPAPTGQYQDLPGAAAPAAAASQAAATQKLIVTPMDGLSGKVSSANSALRFAVLTFPVGHLPAINSHLTLYRHGLKVAEVNVTGPQRDDSIVADILVGDAETGDEVRDR